MTRRPRPDRRRTDILVDWLLVGAGLLCAGVALGLAASWLRG